MKKLITQHNNLPIGILVFLVLFGVSYPILLNNLPYSNFTFLISGMITLYVLYGKNVFKTIFAPFSRPVKLGRYYLLTMFMTFGSLFIINLFHISTSTNPAAERVSDNLLSELLKSIPALIGEELFSICAFLIIGSILYKFTNNQQRSVIISLVLSALAFGALHIPTYNGNLIQALVFISIARILYNLAIFKNDTLWGGILIHIADDWTLFIIFTLSQLILK